MDIASGDIVALFERALATNTIAEYAEIGRVLQVGDASCRVFGLQQAQYGELVAFDGGNRGIVLNLDEHVATVFLLHAHIPVDELELVRRTGTVYTVPVGWELCGRVVNAQGMPIDGLGELHTTETRPIEAVIPSIVDRAPINASLETGIMVVDALVPIGKGQRELIIGNRSTGKTTMVLDIIAHQKGKQITCIYVSIGQRQSYVARMVQLLAERGALDYTIVVSANASEPALDRYVAPYVGCSMAEFFRDQGKDALVIYDDLSSHAVAYREMSLIMRRPAGREAYPGDIFYLHSRLLERAGRMKHGGTLTALPIVQTQADDITSYIPTNLISITDGQIFLDGKLFNAGVRPAVNVELSVSRVGGAAQTKAMRQMTRALRLELAQYHELLDFAQFGAELDPISQQRLARGGLVVELLKQPEGITYSFVDQVLMLFLLREHMLDGFALAQAKTFALQYVSYVQSVYPDTYDEVLRSQELGDATRSMLKQAALELGKLFGMAS